MDCTQILYPRLILLRKESVHFRQVNIIKVENSRSSVGFWPHCYCCCCRYLLLSVRVLGCPCLWFLSLYSTTFNILAHHFCSTFLLFIIFYLLCSSWHSCLYCVSPFVFFCCLFHFWFLSCCCFYFVSVLYPLFVFQFSVSLSVTH